MAVGKHCGAKRIVLPFIVGSVWSRASFLQVIVEKPRELVETPMILRMEPVCLPGTPPTPPCAPGELVFLHKCEVVVRAGACDVGEIVTAPGTVWRPSCPPSSRHEGESCHGGQKIGQEWRLEKPIAAVGFTIGKGELRRMTLSFTTPTTLASGSRPLVRIFQRNDQKVITGGVQLELQVTESDVAKAGEPLSREMRQAKAPAKKVVGGKPSRRDRG
jgi:hypothetical protein